MQLVTGGTFVKSNVFSSEWSKTFAVVFGKFVISSNIYDLDTITWVFWHVSWSRTTLPYTLSSLNT